MAMAMAMAMTLISQATEGADANRRVTAIAAECDEE